MNNNQNPGTFDLWGVHRDAFHLKDGLDIIVEHKDKINEPLTLFVNCACIFEVNGKKIGRYYDTLIYSKEADIAIFLSNATDATPQEIVTFLRSNNIPYQAVTGGLTDLEKNGINDENVLEVWFARDKEILGLALDESIDEFSCFNATFYPNIKANLSMGYYVNDKFVKIFEVSANGIVETDNNLTLITDERRKYDENNIPEKLKGNMSASEVIEVIKEMNIDLTIDEGIELRTLKEIKKAM
jgi:hypothetical protein